MAVMTREGQWNCVLSQEVEKAPCDGWKFDFIDPETGWASFTNNVGDSTFFVPDPECCTRFGFVASSVIGGGIVCIEKTGDGASLEPSG